MDPTTFPSDAWFETMVADTAARPDVYQRLGFGDFRLIVEVHTPRRRVRRFGLVLDGYDALYAGELGDVDAFRPDATISGPLDTWQEMVAAVVAEGVASGAHTLNALTIAEAPLRVSSVDPLGRDKFFRYAETLQTLFDAVGRGAVVA